MKRWKIITLGYKKYTHLTLLLLRVETSVSALERERDRQTDREMERQKQTEDCYIDPYLVHVVIPYSRPQWALLLLHDWGVHCPPGASVDHLLVLSEPPVALWARDWDWPCIYNFIMPTHFSGFQLIWAASACLHRCVRCREIPEWQLSQRSICNTCNCNILLFLLFLSLWYALHPRYQTPISMSIH